MSTVNLQSGLSITELSVFTGRLCPSGGEGGRLGRGKSALDQQESHKIYLHFQNIIFLLINMSFQNSISKDGSININVIPSFGHIVNVTEIDKTAKLREVEAWRSRKGALHSMPRDFDPTRYASFSVKEVVQEPVSQDLIFDYVERSRLSKRLGF